MTPKHPDNFAPPVSAETPEQIICTNPEQCCRELSRVWAALGVTEYNGKSASENVTLLTQTIDRDRQTIASLREAERTVASLACMLGWDNVPPRETLERSVSALNARVREVQQLTEERQTACQRLEDTVAAWDRERTQLTAELASLRTTRETT